MKIENTNFKNVKNDENNLFIFTLGFQQRSHHILDNRLTLLNSNNTIIVVLGEYKTHEHITKKIKEVNERGLRIEYIDYSNLSFFTTCIQNFLSNASNREYINIHVDYSVMPKSWYCRLPQIIFEQRKNNYEVTYWYSEGQYVKDSNDYPSAGIDSFSFFSGKPSLVIDERRTHIIALGFDIKRSTAITTLLDPEEVINVYSYNPNREGFEEKLGGINSSLISRASFLLKFDINNFLLMFSMLNETINEILPDEVILVPDGPKPLIFAMSLVSSLYEREGVSCLHVSGNPEMFELVNVIPTGNVVGFKMIY